MYKMTGLKILFPFGYSSDTFLISILVTTRILNVEILLKACS